MTQANEVPELLLVCSCEDMLAERDDVPSEVLFIEMDDCIAIHADETIVHLDETQVEQLAKWLKERDAADE